MNSIGFKREPEGAFYLRLVRLGETGEDSGADEIAGACGVETSKPRWFARRAWVSLPAW
jgi:hypothetical protein